MERKCTRQISHEDGASTMFVESRNSQIKKARRSTQVLVCGKAFNQAEPAKRGVGLFTHAGGHRP
jgi:hypothetical protein